MRRVKDKELALKISKRIAEIEQLTGLTLLGLAEFCNIGQSAIRSYYSGTIPISVETVSKICKPFSIPLQLFFDFDTLLPENLASNAALMKFHDVFISKSAGYFSEEPKPYVAPKTRTHKPRTNVQLADVRSAAGRKKERDFIAYIVYQTKYFDTPKSITQMITDFKSDYQLPLESGRIYQLLQKYVNNELHTDLIFPFNADGSVSKRSVQTYQKKKK